MENDSVLTSAEAESEEEAMAIARTTASAFYGSKAAMFEYAVYPPSPEPGDGSRRNTGKSYAGNNDNKKRQSGN
jgi:hypothetical protein